ncbi:hypothetical protein [Nocardioides aurantiacus]|uniref:hypothetical protein n=1 Tax=Nocardioides aurantiacus TaxID=86796 RepID=UPI00403F2E05
MDPMWGKHVPKPVSVHVHEAPAWSEQDSLHSFLFWHGSPRNLRRVLKFLRGKARRNVTTLQFDQSQVMAARIDTRARSVTFLSPRYDDDDLEPMTLGYEEVVALFEGYVAQGGVPGRMPDD